MLMNETIKYTKFQSPQIHTTVFNHISIIDKWVIFSFPYDHFSWAHTEF